MAIEVAVPLLETAAGPHPECPTAPPDGLRNRVLVTVFWVRGEGSDAHLGGEAQPLPFGGFCNDVNDPTTRPRAVDGSGPGDHFNALDLVNMQGIQLPANTAHGVQRNPIDQVQGWAPPQCLGEIGQCLRAWTKTWHDFPEGLRQAGSPHQLLLQLVAVNHLDRLGKIHDGVSGSAGLHDHHLGAGGLRYVRD